MLRVVVAAVMTAAVLAVSPIGAEAASVNVRPSARFDLFVPGHEVVLVAAPAERSRVTVQSAYGGTPWTVSDTGAVLEPGPGCAAVDAHTVRCHAPAPTSPMSGLLFADVQLGDLEDEVRMLPPDASPSLFRLFTDGGTGDDVLHGPQGGGELHGGPGSDTLMSTAGFTRTAVLDGGGGRDRLYGGTGNETLLDGDSNSAVGEAAPGPDVIDGGAGVDTVSYRDRTAAVSVDLADTRPDGAPREGDLVRGIESIVGGQGDDQLFGDGLRNQIDGQGGHDTLRGRGDDDQFSNGRGPISCGTGNDVILYPASTDYLRSDCESVTNDLDDPEGVAAYPTRVRAKSVQYRIHCRRDEDDGFYYPCTGRVTMRQAGARRRIGTGRTPRGPWADRAVNVRLTPLGRRLASSRRGVLATVKLTVDTWPPKRWTIHLRVPRSPR